MAIKHNFVNQNEKKNTALKALKLVPSKGLVGLGSGTTIDTLAGIINKTNKAEFVCVSKNARKILQKRGLFVVEKGRPDSVFDGADSFVKKAGKLIAIKGAGAFGFTKEKELDYSAKKLIIIAGESKLKNKSHIVFVEVKKPFLNTTIKLLRKVGLNVKKVPKTNALLKGKINSFLKITPKTGTNFAELERFLDGINGVVGNGIFSNKKFDLIIGKNTPPSQSKTRLQIALDFDNEKQALDTARQVKDYADIIEIGTPLVKALNEKQIIEKLSKFKRKLFVDLKTMDAGYFESSPAIRYGGEYVSVLGVASDETVKGVLQNGVDKVVVDLIGCKDVVLRIKQLKKIGAVNFEVHAAIDDQKKGKTPLEEVAKASKIKGINIWTAGGIGLSSLDAVMEYKPAVIVVGGAVTHSKDQRNAAKHIKERILELS
ncbi:MAG: ribose-5-phosphate isomerase A [Candidatus Diapherotrites archaeon]|nr:ribose-5-phosphate isomerase A [Candidatus Diapherotrites archaeon]